MDGNYGNYGYKTTLIRRTMCLCRFYKQYALCTVWFINRVIEQSLYTCNIKFIGKTI